MDIATLRKWRERKSIRNVLNLPRRIQAKNNKPFASGLSATVMLVDDQILYRDCLSKLIVNQGQFTVVAQVGFDEGVFQLIQTLSPDIILMDPCLNHEINVPFIFKLAPKCLQSQILLIASPCGKDIYFEFIRAGVSGIVLKTQPFDVLLTAIERVLSKELWFDRSLLTSHNNKLEKATQINKSEQDLSCLSKRERDIVNEVVLGHNTQTIAKKLSISEKTVRNHIYSIYGKLEVRDRLELALFAANSLKTIKFDSFSEKEIIFPIK